MEVGLERELDGSGAVIYMVGIGFMHDTVLGFEES